jgi:hypothetical protein
MVQEKWNAVKKKWNEPGSVWKFAKWAFNKFCVGAKFVGNLLYKAIRKSD